MRPFFPVVPCETATAMTPMTANAASNAVSFLTGSMVADAGPGSLRGNPWTWPVVFASGRA
jgi:hypothetical protein